MADTDINAASLTVTITEALSVGHDITADARDFAQTMTHTFTSIANVCLQNPTELPGWTDDDIYPIPQYLVQDLTQSVLQELQAQLAVPNDRISDNADTAKLVQQKVQR